MSSAYERVQELAQDAYTQAEYATRVMRETNRQEIQDAVFSQNPFKKAGLHLWEGVKRFGSTLKSGFKAVSSFAKSVYGTALAGLNLGKYAKHKYEKAQQLNAREDALNKAAEQLEVERKALEQGRNEVAVQAKANAEAQKALARVALNEAEGKDRLAAQDSNAFWENSSWAGGRGVEAAVDAAYTLANGFSSGAYVASSAWHTASGVAGTTNQILNGALAKIEDYFAAQAVDAATSKLTAGNDSLLETLELPQFRNERAANASSLKQQQFSEMLEVRAIKAAAAG